MPFGFKKFSITFHRIAWKVSKYGVFCRPYFPVFGLNTEIYELNPEEISYLNTFHTARAEETISLLFNPIKPGKSFLPAANLNLNHFWMTGCMNLKLDFS